jgi:transposase-like protein
MPERRKYDSEFRQGAVTIVRETGRPIAEVARELGIGAGTLGNWVKRTGSPGARRLTGPGWTRVMCVGSSGRTPSCGWSVMC